MLHILLLILKIIGIVLLVILGLLLAAVLLVLLVPLRYRLNGSWHGGPAGQVRVTWLLHAVSLLAAYENGLDITAKLFGFTVFHSAAAEGGETDEAVEDIDSQDADAAGWQEDEVEGTKRPVGWQEEGTDGTNWSADEADMDIDIPDDGEPVNATSLEMDDGSGMEGGVESVAEEVAEAIDNQDADAAGLQEEGADGAKQPVNEAEVIDISRQPTLEEQLRQDEADSEDASFGDTDLNEDALSGGIDFIDRIEDIFDRIGEKLEWADKKRRWIERFLEDPKNQKTIRLVWRQAKAMLCHILPRKAAGQVTFGFDDPAMTGNVLAACSVLFAMYGTQLTVTPDFENKVIDGDLQLQGRICIGTLAARTVRVMIDRNLWRMIKKVRKFLESGGK